MCQWATVEQTASLQDGAGIGATKSCGGRSARDTCTNHPPENRIPGTNGPQIKIYRQRILTNIQCLKGQPQVPSMWAMLFICLFGARYFLFCLPFPTENYRNLGAVVIIKVG